MKLPDEDKGARGIVRALRPQLEAAEKLFECVLNAAKTLPPAGGGGGAGECQRACLSAAWARLLRLHYAAVKLAGVGIAAEAMPQVRAMFELVVNACALEQSPDPEEYARRWIAWAFCEGPERAASELARSVKRDMDAEARREGRARWPQDEERVAAYVAGTWTEFLKHGPSRADLRSLAASVDLRSGEKTRLAAAYERLYPNASGVLHGADLGSALDLAKDRPAALDLVPTPEGVETVLVASAVFLEMGTLTITRTLGAGSADLQKRMLEILRPAVPGI